MSKPSAHLIPRKSRSTVYEWLANNAAFLTMYRAAREEHADAEFDRIAAANITCMAAGS